LHKFQPAADQRILYNARSAGSGDTVRALYDDGNTERTFLKMQTPWLYCREIREQQLFKTRILSASSDPALLIVRQGDILLRAATARSFGPALVAHRDGLFTFLRLPGLDATNWRAVLAIRFGVILRKVWGGSRTWAGARAQAVLMSVWRTCWQQGRSAPDFLSQLLRGTPVALPSPP
jgi:hypothetical protein